jgi:threo-3-hydroxy-L-aspartate ammonia-lyase
MKSSSVLLPTYADIELATARLGGLAHRTPVLRSRIADSLVGAKMFFKCENLQRAGSFKFRGAFNSIAALSPDQRERGVVTFSSGNHAQAMALAGQLQGVPTTVVMPKDAPAMKIEATRSYGGRVQFYDRYTESREAIATRLSSEGGLTLIPPFEHPDVIAGQGTATRELFEEVGELHVLFVPLGGGGLLAGAALAAKALSPRCRVIGVEPEAGNDGQRSLRGGHIVEISVPQSIADGALTNRLGALNFQIIQALVADIATVSDEMLIRSMQFFASRMKLVVEPTGWLAAAAAMSKAFHQPGERVAILVSGGNVDLDRLAKLISAS